MKCEVEGCEEQAKYRDPNGNILCRDCVWDEVEREEYEWDDVEAL